MNQKWLKVDREDLYQFTIWIAESPAREKEAMVKAIEKFIGTYIVSAEQWTGHDNIRSISKKNRKRVTKKLEHFTYADA